MQLRLSFRDGPNGSALCAARWQAPDQTSDVQLHIGESRDSGFTRRRVPRNDDYSKRQRFGRGVEPELGGLVDMRANRIADSFMIIVEPAQFFAGEHVGVDWGEGEW